jgi:hypothetical protein
MFPAAHTDIQNLASRMYRILGVLHYTWVGQSILITRCLRVSPLTCGSCKLNRLTQPDVSWVLAPHCLLFDAEIDSRFLPIRIGILLQVSWSKASNWGSGKWDDEGEAGATLGWAGSCSQTCTTPTPLTP